MKNTGLFLTRILSKYRIEYLAQLIIILFFLLENQCNQEASTCDYAEALQDQYIIYTDKTINAFSDATCQAACTSETSFVCRSYTFR